MNNFDLKKFLTENKLTNNSKLLNENYRERNDNLQFIINVLKAGKTSPIIEIFEKIVEHNDNDNLDQEIDQAVEEVIDEDESLKKYLDYESSKGSMYYGDMKEVKAGDLDMEKLARIFEKGKKLRLLYAGTGFNTKQSMNDINLIGTIVSAGEEAFWDYEDELEGLTQREIPVDLMPIDSIRDPKMKAAWEELAYALDFNAAAYEYEYDELEGYYSKLVDIVNNFPSEYLSESSDPRFDDIAMGHSNTAPNTPPGATPGTHPKSNIKVGDKLKHKGTGAEMVVTKVSGDELTMKYTSVGSQPGAKVGGLNKTSAKLVGKSYDLI